MAETVLVALLERLTVGEVLRDCVPVGEGDLEAEPLGVLEGVIPLLVLDFVNTEYQKPKD